MILLISPYWNAVPSMCDVIRRVYVSTFRARWGGMVQEHAQAHAVDDRVGFRLSAVLSRFQIQVHAPCTSSIALTIRAEAVRIVAISFGASYE